MSPRRGSVRLLDHLIRPRQQRLRDDQPQGLRDLHVDDQRELGWLLDRQVGGSRALEDPVDEGRDLFRQAREARPVGYERPASAVSFQSDIIGR